MARVSIAYVVLAHRDPDHLARLVGRLTATGAAALVHVDATTDITPFAAALSPFTATGACRLVEDRVSCGWGDYSLVDATVRTTAAALSAHAEASHVVLLSGLDYPVEPADEIDRFFADHPGTSFMFSSAGDEGPVDRTGNLRWHWDGRMDRLGRRHLRLGGRSVPLPNRYVPWFPMRRMPRGLRPLQGSQWWAMSADTARRACGFLADRPDVVRFFRGVEVPDEHVLQMVVDALPGEPPRVVQDDLHHIDWGPLGNGKHPRVLVLDDLEALVASPKLYARKVDPGASADLLDRLDQLHDGRTDHAPR